MTTGSLLRLTALRRLRSRTSAAYRGLYVLLQREGRASTPRPGCDACRGWSLVHLTSTGCESRPLARDWEPSDTIELVVIGDLGSKASCEVRGVLPDVD